jgi:hypothetical protein
VSLAAQNIFFFMKIILNSASGWRSVIMEMQMVLKSWATLGLEWDQFQVMLHNTICI